MKKLSDFFDLKKISIFLITLPYLTFNYKNIINSPFFSFPQLLLFIAILLFLDFIIKCILLYLNIKSKTIISLIIFFISALFYYGLYISIYLQTFLLEQFQILIRGRVITTFVVIVLLIIIKKQKKERIHFQYINVFLILFSIITFFFNIINNKVNKKEVYKSSISIIPFKNGPIKPIILIICDEYTSPDDLYKTSRDSSVYNFSNELTRKGWKTKNSFYSYEISTIHSLSSLFNFNLSKNKKYGNEPIADIGADKLMNANLSDSLEKKKVKIVNFGIFHLGKHKYLSRLYLYPTSFIQDIMLHSIYYILKYNTGNFEKVEISTSYYPIESHNKYIFEHLVDTLNNLAHSKTFVYTHLFMPHGPMMYSPSFPLRAQNNLSNYRAYWDFTNQKLLDLLHKLTKQNKYRIILTGDHGYRGDKKINPNFTFIAFYGFSNKSFNNIESVQDLGGLIYEFY